MIAPTKLRIRRRSVLSAAAGSLLAAPSIVRAQGHAGVALVIGNSKYKWEASLPNAQRDATDVARVFRALGLKTELVQDASRRDMVDAIDRFGSGARGANLAAFYFAGHGAQWNNSPYLVPIDADLSEPRTDGLVTPESVRKASLTATHKLRVFDNCRNNPADGWRQKQTEDRSLTYGTDFARTQNNNPNTLVVWSTVSGRVALDGPAGQNSPFATALLHQLDGESIDFLTLAEKVRRAVLLSTRGRQVPSSTTSFTEPFSIRGARLGLPAPPGVDRAGIIELDKAYAFVREKKFLLPKGMVALRPAGNALLRQKVGSFKYNITLSEPLDLILIVLSADTEDNVQVIQSGPQRNGWWRFVSGRIENDRLEFQEHSALTSPHNSFRWHDANSGRMTMMWPGQTSQRPRSAEFERLDG